MSYEERVPVENDEEMLAMKRGDMPSPVPKRVANPRNREDQALQEMHHAASDDASHKHGSIVCQRTSVAFSSNMGSFNRNGDQRT